MWFWFALIALLCWSGSDLFSKIGCQDSSDKYSHLKMVMAVGIVMGLHAAYEIFIGKVGITWEIILMYLPVSMLYILSMAIGYLGLRYIELSISSPICNSSGAIVAVLTLITVGIGDDLPPLALVAVALVCIGVIALGITESNEDEELRRARQDESNRHYAKSWLAIALPVIYCLLDALGTFADSRVLEKLGEELADACNVAYELTFLVMGIACTVYVLGIKKQRLIPKQEGPKYLCAVCDHHFLLLRGERYLGAYLPQGKALEKALCMHRARRGGHRHHGHPRYLTILLYLNRQCRNYPVPALLFCGKRQLLCPFKVL